MDEPRISKKILNISSLLLSEGKTEKKLKFTWTTWIGSSQCRISREVRVYSEPSRTSRIEPFTKIVKGQKLLTIFAKSSFVDVRMGSEYASGGINEPARHLHFDDIELTDVNI